MLSLDWKNLSPTEFEELCKDLLCDLGYIHVKRMSGVGGGDMGQDIIAEETVSHRNRFSETIKLMVQCKNYAPSKTTIKPNIVEKYVNRAETFGFSQLLIITSYDLTSQAKITVNTINNNPKKTVKVTFWNEIDLLNFLQQYPKTKEKYFPKQEEMPELKEELIHLTQVIPFWGPESENSIALPITIEGLTIPTTFFARVDTGFGGSLILGHKLFRFLKNELHLEEINAEGIPLSLFGYNVSADVYLLRVKLPTMEQAITVEAYHLHDEKIDTGNIIGLNLLRNVNLVILGKDEKVGFAVKSH